MIKLLTNLRFLGFRRAASFLAFSLLFLALMIHSSVAYSQDADLDGIDDINDVDDDNDGILDLNEFAMIVTAGLPSTSFENLTVTGNVGIASGSSVVSHTPIFSLQTISAGTVAVYELTSGNGYLSITLESENGTQFQVDVSSSRPSLGFEGVGGTGSAQESAQINLEFFAAADAAFSGAATIGDVAEVIRTGGGTALTKTVAFDVQDLDGISGGRIEGVGVSLQSITSFVTELSGSTISDSLDAITGFISFTGTVNNPSDFIRIGFENRTGLRVQIFNDTSDFARYNLDFNFVNSFTSPETTTFVGDGDGDGILGAEDLDSDNDGIADIYEAGDATVAAYDLNGDGFINSVGEGFIDSGSGGAVANNGLDDRIENIYGAGFGVTPVDSESSPDGSFDFVDLDSENDGIPDATEARGISEYIAYVLPISAASDSDNDGILDIYDDTVGFGSTLQGFKTSTRAPNDTDGDANDSANLSAASVSNESSISNASNATGAVDGNDAILNSSFDVLVLDLGQVVQAGTEITVTAQVTGFAGFDGINEIQISESNSNGTILSNTQADFFASNAYEAISYTLSSATQYIDIGFDRFDGNLEVDAVEFTVTGSSVIPDYLDIDSDNDGNSDADESDSPAISGVSFSDPDGNINNPLSSADGSIIMENVDLDPSDIDFRSLNAVPNPMTISLNTPAAITASNASSYPISGSCTENGDTISVTIASTGLTTSPATPTCSGGSFSFTADTSGLSDGSNLTIEVTISDNGAVHSDVSDSAQLDKDVVSPSIAITATSKLNNASITDTTIQVTDSGGVTAANISVDGSSTVTTSSLSCTQTSSTQVDCTISIDSSGDLVVAATDDAGNANTDSETAYIIETVAPSISITAPTKLNNASIINTTIRVTDAVGVTASNVSVAGASTVTTSSFSCAQTSSTQVDCTISIDSSGGLVIAATDDAGNPSSASESNYVVDAAAPAISITAPTKLNNASITNTTIQVTDAGGVTASNVTVNGSSTAATSSLSCSQTLATQVDCSISVDSSGDLVIAATDDAGNSDTEAETAYIIETVAPSIAITAPTKLDNASITNTTIRVTDANGITAANVSVGGGSTATTSSFSCTQTSGTQVDCTISVDSSGDLVIAATDDAGNSDTESETAYVIETVAPSIAITAPTKLDNASITDTTIRVSDANGITAANVTVSGSSTATTSSLSCTQTSGTQVDCTISVDSSGDLVIAATDDAGNSVTDSEASYIIETVAPSIAITAPSKLDNASITDTTIQVTDANGVNAANVSVSGSSTAGTSSLSCTQTSATQVDCTISVDSSGDLVIAATDNAGNPATESETAYIIDVLAPSAASCIFSPAGALADVNVTATCSGVESGGSVTINGMTCGVESGGTVTCNGLSQNIGDIPAIITEDAAGNSTPSTGNFDLLGIPVVSIDIPDTANESNQNAYEVSGNCSAGDGDVTVTIAGATPNIQSVSCNGAGEWTATFDVSAISDGDDVIIVDASQTNSDGTGNAPQQTADKDSGLPVAASCVFDPAIGLTGQVIEAICTGVESGGSVTIPGMTCGAESAGEVTCTGLAENIGDNPPVTTEDPAGNSTPSIGDFIFDDDTDGDGIPDSIEGTGDTDGDGLPDFNDPDSDNDGIPDDVESGVDPLNPVDSDNDGMPDYRDIDSDNDNVLDIVEAGNTPLVPVDTDGDSMPDYLDVDSDNDTVLDVLENVNPTLLSGNDGDNDGVDDAVDFDLTGGNDTNTNGVDDALEAADSDGDGIANHLDLDSDNDGLLDTLESPEPLLVGNDADNDGIDDVYDVDATAGNDANANGIDDSVEPVDTDGDGKANYLDIDSDNDSLPDTLEALPNGVATPPLSGSDADNDGIDDAFDADNGGAPIATPFVNTDGDTVADYLDLDSDNDSLFDISEAGNGVTVDEVDDINLNGLIDDLADEGSTNPAADSDSDSIPDFRDLESDDASNDGIGPFDLDDNPGAPDDLSPVDGIVDDTDDMDEDGIPDDADPEPESFGAGTDSDMDGIPDNIDLDDDNDGISDLLEGFDADNPENSRDTDGDTVPDYLDRDSDNDGLTDLLEATSAAPAAGTDDDNDGEFDALIDVDIDGLDDDRAVADPVDSDADGIPDYQDIDSDNDGISDLAESVVDGFNVATLDADDDGRIDAVSLLTGLSATPITTQDDDADSRPDFRDFTGTGIEPAPGDEGLRTSVNGGGAMNLVIVFGLCLAAIRKAVKARLATALLAIFSSMLSQADDNYCAYAGNGSENSITQCLYLGGGLNYSHLHPESDDSDNWDTDDSDDKSLGWSVNIGYRISERLFAELKYMDQGKAGLRNPNPILDDAYPDAAITYKTFSLMGGYYIFDRSNVDTQNARWNAYVKAGYANISNDVERDGGTVEFTEENNHQLALGIGVEYRRPYSPWFARINLDVYDQDSLALGLEIQRFIGGNRRQSVPVVDSQVAQIKEPVVETMSEPVTEPAQSLEEIQIVCDKFNVVVDDIYFATNSADLVEVSKEALSTYAVDLKRYPEVVVEVGAHTDWKGSGSYNLELSNRRAASVVSYLVSLGVHSDQLRSQGYGETKPIADNNTEFGRQANRRVEMKVIDSVECE